MADLTLHDLHKRFGDVTALGGVSLEVPSGTFLSLLGPSGCGKSTLLRCIAGLERVSSGRISIAGEDLTGLPPEQRRLGMMFQSYALLPHMSVSENVRFPLRMQGELPVDEQRRKVRETLELVHMDGYEDRMPRQLSGGQQQRVALARAVVSRPRVLLLDEPLSNLDARLREEMQIELIEMHRELRLTTVFVTHDQDEAMSLSDVVVLMNAGRVEQTGSPQQMYNEPASTFAADFLGAANLLPVTVARDPDGPIATLPGGERVRAHGEVPEGEGTLVLRQEDLRLGAPGADDDCSLPVRVVARAFRGASVQYVVGYHDHWIRTVMPKSAPLVDEASELTWRSADARLLPGPPPAPEPAAEASSRAGG